MKQLTRTKNEAMDNGVGHIPLGERGVDAIAKLHNRELEQVKDQMNKSSKKAQLDNSKNMPADRADLSGGAGPGSGNAVDAGISKV